LPTLRRTDGGKRIKIILIAPEYPPRNIGGGGIVFQNLANQLRRNGHDIKVIAGSFVNRKLVGQVETRSDYGVPVFFVPLLPSTRRGNLDTTTYSLPTLSASTFMTKQLLQSKNATIHLHGLSHPMIDLAALECCLLRRKYVLTCHGIPKTPETANTPIRLLFKLYLATVERTIARRAMAVTFVSKALMKECRTKGITNKKMRIVPNGPNKRLAKPKTINSINEKYVLKGKQVIFAIGRLNPTKGFQHLIQAMQYVAPKLPNATAIIAGSGTYKKTLEEIIIQTGLTNQVKLVGEISEEEKAALYKRSDVVVFPSLQEPFGLVILEAYAMQKPIIAFNTESAQEIINDKITGLLVPLRDDEKLAEAIIQVLTDKKIAEKLVANATDKSSAFEWEKITLDYENIYSEMNKKVF
jgi:glycosyltransferase involved in cell wall biosynthesis